MKVLGNGTNVNSNILNLRTKLGLTQIQFIQAMEEASGGQFDMRSTTTLSALERGRRPPTVRDLITICKTFNIKIESLCGLKYVDDSSSESSGSIQKTSDSNSGSIWGSIWKDSSSGGKIIRKDSGSDNMNIQKSPDSDSQKEIPTILNHGGAISPNMIPRYDGMPVYVVSKDKVFKEGWGILNNSKKAIVFKDKVISINNVDMTIYTYPPQNRDFASGSECPPLSLSSLLKTERVWVELLGADIFYEGRYNGWYHHAEDNTALINDGNGHILPYAGLGITYNAYKINTDKSTK